MKTDQHGFENRARRLGRFAMLGLPVAILLISVVIGVSLHAQLNLGANPQSLYGRDTTQSVYVRDSAVAVEKFALAERMEHLREWDKSADVYQEILRSYADRVVPSQIDKDNKIYQYTSVTPAVQERLAKWPEEGLAVYKARYEGEAAASLENSRDDPANLHRVFAQHFVTDSGKRAAIRLTDIYLERGEFAAAAWLGERMLTWHPSLADDRPRLLYRTSLAYHLAGNAELAKAKLDELMAKSPNAIATVRGGDVVLAESLAQELAAPPQPGLREGAASTDSWPMAFGSPDRSRVSQSSTFGGARLVPLELPKLSLRNLRPDQRRTLEDNNTRDMGTGIMTGIFPVVDRGELFFQDNARVYAVSLESGSPLPGWAETYAGERAGRYVLPNAVPTPRSQQCTITVTDDSVLAVMGQLDIIAMSSMGTYGQRDTRLVCLDRTTGRQKWVVSPRLLPEQAANLRALELVGSPLVIGDRVYVQARGGKGMQFEDSYVLCFDLAGGVFRWACYVCSANSTGMGWDGDVSSLMEQNVSHIAYSSGRLYACTNLGAVAAIDAYDGTIVWLNIYPRNAADPMRARLLGGRMRRFQQAGVIGAAGGGGKPWAYNPVIVSQGKVFILPNDAVFVHVYDAGNGVEFARIPLQDFGNARTMLGVVEQKLVINSENEVFCIDWQNFDSKKRAEENLLWSSKFRRPAGVDDSIRGRGIVTADSVIIPTAWQLMRLTLKSGLVVDTYPSGDGGAWSEEEGPGNVLVTQDRLIIAGPTAAGSMRVNVFTDLARAVSKLDAAIAAAPSDPAPRLRYADILFAAGKPDEALGKLDEAIQLIGGGGAMPSGPARDRVFNMALTFAQKLSKDRKIITPANPNPEPTTATTDIVNMLFDRADAAAGSPSQKVNYRLSRAALAKQRLAPADEVRLYQEILSDEQLRGVPVADADGDTTPASELSRRSIDDAIRRGGSSVYATYDQAATDMLEAARLTLDPLKMQAIAQVYPNASAAPRALLAAADFYEAADNPRMATQVLRQALFRYPNSSDQPRIVEAMARNYLRMPNRVHLAAARLKHGAGGGASGRVRTAVPRLSRPLVLPDGRQLENMNFLEAAEALRQFDARSAATALPDIALPSQQGARGRPRLDFAPEDAQTTIAQIGALIVPENEFVRHDRLVTHTPGAGVRAYVVGATEPVMRSGADAFAQQPPTGAAWIGGVNLLVWNTQEVMYLSENSGQLLWKTSLRDAPQLEIVARAGDTAPPAPGPVANAAQRAQLAPNVQVGPGGLVVVDGNFVIGGAGRLVVNGVVIGPNGQVIQPAVGAAAPPGAEADAAGTGVEQIVYVRPLSDRVLVGTTAGRIIAYDLDGAKLLWQTRVGDRAPHNLRANDDFIVTRHADDNGISALVTVLDTYSGQVVTRKVFGQETGAGMFAVNLALSPDGMLVVLLQDRIIGKDLFEPGGLDRPTYLVPPRPNDAAAAAAGAVGMMTHQISQTPDHLQIVDDRLIVASQENQSLIVRAYSLHDGSPIKADRADAMIRLNEMALNGRFMMRSADGRVYCASPREVRGWDPQRGQTWTSGPGPRTVLNVRDLIVTRGHLLLISEPGGPRGQRRPDQPSQFVQVKAFSRALVPPSGAESGVFEHDVDINATSPIVSWQAVDGGFYYLTADQKLHFLRGAKETEKAER